MTKTSVLLTGFWGLVLALLLTGCASTETELSSWVDPQAKAVHPSHVLVIAMVDKETTREVFENKIAEKLQSSGVKVTPSHKVSNITHWDNKAQLEALIQGVEADSVLIADLIGVEEEEMVHPPQTYSVPVGGYYGYYHAGWQTVHQPGYISRHKVVRLESNLYDARTDRLIWSARSKTLDPKNAIDAMDSVVAAMIDDLKEKGLIRK